MTRVQSKTLSKGKYKGMKTEVEKFSNLLNPAILDWHVR